MPQNHKEKPFWIYYVILFLCVLVWSTVPIASKSGMADFGPLTFAWLRGATASILLLPIAVKYGLKFKNFFTFRSMFYGLIAFVLNTMLMTFGMQWCSANVSSITQASMPILLLFGGVIFLSEKLTLFKALGAIAATLGIVITCLGGSLIDASTTVAGILIVASAPLTWTIYTIFMKKKDPDVNPMIITTYSLVCGVIIGLPLMLGEIIFVTGIPHASVSSWMLAAYAGFVCLGIGNLTWTIGVSKIHASVSGLFYNLCPIIGVLWAVLWGEKISLLQISGCIIVVAGILIGMKDEFKLPKISKNITSAENKKV